MFTLLDTFRLDTARTVGCDVLGVAALLCASEATHLECDAWHQLGDALAHVRRRSFTERDNESLLTFPADQSDTNPGQPRLVAERVHQKLLRCSQIAHGG